MGVRCGKSDASHLVFGMRVIKKLWSYLLPDLLKNKTLCNCTLYYLTESKMSLSETELSKIFVAMRLKLNISFCASKLIRKKRNLSISIMFLYLEEVHTTYRSLRIRTHNINSRLLEQLTCTKYNYYI